MSAEPMAFFKLGAIGGNTNVSQPNRLQAVISAAYRLGVNKRYGAVPEWDELDISDRIYIRHQLRECPLALEILKEKEVHSG